MSNSQMRNSVAIFDIGRTNKKLFVLDEDYRIVWEKSSHFPDTRDDDGEECENLAKLTSFILYALDELSQKKEFTISAINFSAYGASLVYIDENGKPLTPLYSYLKGYPESLKRKFYDSYGGENKLSFETASPVLGSLNSGMQFYRL